MEFRKRKEMETEHIQDKRHVKLQKTEFSDFNIYQNIPVIDVDITKLRKKLDRTPYTFSPSSSLSSLSNKCNKCNQNCIVNPFTTNSPKSDIMCYYCSELSLRHFN